MKIKDVLKDHPNAVVITHYRPDADYSGGQAPQNPGCLLQVTLLSDKISGSGHFIRLGDTGGDELIGWTRIDSLEVDEILGELQADGKTVKPVEASKDIPIEWPPRWSLNAQEAA